MFGAPSIVPEVGCRALIAPGFIRSMAAGSRRGLSITYWARGVRPGRRGTSALVVFLSAEIAATPDICAGGRQVVPFLLLIAYDRTRKRRVLPRTIAAG